MMKRSVYIFYFDQRKLNLQFHIGMPSLKFFKGGELADEMIGDDFDKLKGIISDNA